MKTNKLKNIFGDVSMLDGHIESEKHSCEDCKNKSFCLPSLNSQANKCENMTRKGETNYDRIRNMSIDELAEYIYNRDDELSGEICRHYMPCPYGEDCKPENCKDCIKKWLQSEVAE